MDRVRHDAPEHVAALRELVGGAVSDAALRNVLVRAAGNMDRAADLLLSSPSVTSRACSAAQQQDCQRVVDHSKFAGVSSVAETSQPTRAFPLQVDLEVSPSSKLPTPSSSIPLEPPSPDEVRKLAWKTFFKEKYVAVKDELCLDALERDKVKKAVTKRIIELWDDLGAEGRDALYAEALVKLEKMRVPKTHPDRPCAAITRSSPVTPQEKTRPRPSEADHAAGETKSKVSRACDAEDVSAGRDGKPVLLGAGRSVNAVSEGKRVEKKTIEDVRAFVSDKRDSHVINVDSTAEVADLNGKAFAEPLDTSPDQSKLVAMKEASETETSWPRRIASRILRCTMTVSGVNVVKAGASVDLSPSNNIVRFSHRGRELGRLPSYLAPFLAPALVSGFVTASARVVEVPKVCRPLSDIYVDVNILLHRHVFQSLSALNLPAIQKVPGNKRNGFKVRKVGRPRGKKANVDDDEDGQGMDFHRLSVEALMVHLDTCNWSSSASDDIEMPVNVSDPEHNAEAYFHAVHAISFPAGQTYQPAPQLTCSLRDYQKVGVMWMQSREERGNASQDRHLTNDAAGAWVHPVWRRRAFSNGETFYSNRATGAFCLEPPVAMQEGPYGGILADEMGLGKTVMSIAVIVADRVRLDAKLGAIEEQEPMESNSEPGASECAEDGVVDSAHTCEQEIVGDIAPATAETGRDEAVYKDGHDGISVVENEVVQRVEVEDEAENVDASAEEANDDSDDDDWSSKGSDDSSDSDFIPDRRHARANLSRASKSAGAKRPRDPEAGQDAPDKSWVQKAQFANHGRALYSRVHKLRMKEKTGSSKKKLQGGTLLVVPMSLIGQWRSELERHVKPGYLRCKTHHEQRGSTVGVSVTVADVVLTTYGIVSSEAPVVDGDGKVAKEGGPLFDVEWRRVILDEAHSIKNKSTKSAQACFQLSAELKWCLTGSPIQNEVSDCQPLLRFLDLQPWSSWGFWQRGVLSKIEAPDPKLKAEGYATLRSILSPITLRRLKTTVGSDGKVLVEMVERCEEIVRLTPGPAERDFYDQLHTKSKSKFDTYVAQGKVLNQWANVLELLLRLRQACCHPWLVLAAPQADAKISDDREGMYKMFASGGSTAFAAHMVNLTQGGSRGECEDGNDSSDRVAASSKPCPICLSDMEDATALKGCGHAGCRDCFIRMLESSHGKPSSCPVCRAPVESKSDLIRLPRGDGSSVRFPMDIRKNWKSSAKLDFIIAEVRRMVAARKVSSDGTVGKTVIMSQFTSFLDIVGVALEKEGTKYLRFDGTLNAKKRAEVLAQFADDDERDAKTAQVLLVSLRSGNVGLNLVSASLLILCDPSWNPMVDAQAAARVHRHGQTRQVAIKRLIIGGTVEDRLLQVQDAKRDMTEGALATASREDKALRVDRMKMLFAR